VPGEPEGPDRGAAPSGGLTGNPGKEPGRQTFPAARAAPGPRTSMPIFQKFLLAMVLLALKPTGTDPEALIILATLILTAFLLRPVLHGRKA
jgi:hypothetical protein